MPSIANRIQLMQTQLDALSAQATQVQQGIDQATTAAGSTEAGLTQADQTLAYVTATARANTGAAQAVERQVLADEARVEVALRETARLRDALTALDGTARELGGGAVVTAQRIHRLEVDVRRLLPGSASIPGRLATLSATLTAHQQGAAAATYPGFLASNLRSRLQRANGRVDALALNITNATAAAQNTTTPGLLVANMIAPLTPPPRPREYLPVS